MHGVILTGRLDSSWYDVVNVVSVHGFIPRQLSNYRYWLFAKWGRAMSTKAWTRQFVSEPFTTPAPLVQNAAQLFTLTAGQTVVRTRFDVQMTVISTGTGSGFDPRIWSQMIIGVGIWWNAAASVPPISQTPISGAGSDNWLIIGALYPTVESYDVASPFTAVAFNPKPGTLESFGQRKVPATQTGSIWLAWEVVDPTGLVNAGGAGVAYSLGFMGQLSCLIETP